MFGLEKLDDLIALANRLEHVAEKVNECVPYLKKFAAVLVPAAVELLHDIRDHFHPDAPPVKVLPKTAKALANVVVDNPRHS